MAGVTNDWISADGLEQLKNYVLSENPLDTTALRLDSRTLPFFNFLMSNSRNLHSIKGGFRNEVKGVRGQSEEAWDGEDWLSFRSKATAVPMRWFVGKTHYGNTNSYDFLERFGIDLVYGEQPGMSSGRKGSDGALTVILNYLREEKDDIAEDLRRNRALRLLRSNASDPKYYVGLDGLIPVTTNNTGEIGGLDRSWDLVQHQIYPSITSTNVHLAMTQANREMNRYAAGATQRMWFVGDSFFDMLAGRYDPVRITSDGPAPGGWTINQGMDSAKALSQRLGIGLPEEAFLDPKGNLIVLEQLFNDLDVIENPAIPWSNRAYGVTNHLRLFLEKNNEYRFHGMPHNRVVYHESWFSSMSLSLRAPRSCAILHL